MTEIMPVPRNSHITVLRPPSISRVVFCEQVLPTLGSMGDVSVFMEELLEAGEVPAEERDIGGLGIFMVKKLMTRVTYTYSEGINILVLEKEW